MFDAFIYHNRYWIGGALIAVILAGSGFLIWDKVGQSKKTQENQVIQNLQTQNNQLRQELSQKNPPASQAPILNATDKINLNTADAAELDKIPGVGAARAAAIINYRAASGGFKTIEEIKNIKGIGDKSFEQIKDLITIRD